MKTRLTLRSARAIVPAWRRFSGNLAAASVRDFGKQLPRRAARAVLLHTGFAKLRIGATRRGALLGFCAVGIRRQVALEGRRRFHRLALCGCRRRTSVTAALFCLAASEDGRPLGVLSLDANFHGKGPQESSRWLARSGWSISSESPSSSHLESAAAPKNPKALGRVDDLRVADAALPNLEGALNDQQVNTRKARRQTSAWLLRAVKIRPNTKERLVFCKTPIGFKSRSWFRYGFSRRKTLPT